MSNGHGAITSIYTSYSVSQEMSTVQLMTTYFPPLFCYIYIGMVIQSEINVLKHGGHVSKKVDHPGG